MPTTVKPANMSLVKLSDPGLAPGAANALVTWHPKVAFNSPLLIVLFFHGREEDPQDFGWKRHHLPEQVADAGKNAILIAPTMNMIPDNQGNKNVDSAYLGSGDRIAKLVADGVAAVAAATGGSAAGALAKARLLLVGYSNGYLAWGRAVRTLRATPAAAPPVIGHSLFDCLYWSTPLMKPNEGVPVDKAQFSDEARGIVDAAFVTTHFTTTGETRDRALSLEAMVRRVPAFKLLADIPGNDDLAAKNVVIANLPTGDHSEAVNSRSELSRVIAASPGFELPLAAVA